MCRISCYASIILFLLISIFPNKIIAQRNALQTDTVKRWKVGLYRTEKDFFKREPSETKPFLIAPVYAVSKNKDSVVVGYSYKYLDSSFRRRVYYGLFDGKDFYLRIKFDLLQKFDRLGKYPFITMKIRRDLPMDNDPSRLTAKWIDYLLAGVNEEIWYLNRKGTFLKATKQAMFFLLADEKDLYEQFLEEKVYNNDVYRKYLVKKNDRYPD